MSVVGPIESGTSGDKPNLLLWLHRACLSYCVCILATVNKLSARIFFSQMLELCTSAFLDALSLEVLLGLITSLIEHFESVRLGRLSHAGLGASLRIVL